MISAATVAAVRAQTDIVVLCRELAIDLRAVRIAPEPAAPRVDTGKLKSYCPFCADADEDFWVDPARQFFHCFACKRNGTVIDLVMGVKGCGFETAVRHLAACAGLHVSCDDRFSGDPPAEQAVARRLEQLQRPANTVESTLFEWMVSLPDAEFWKLRDDMSLASSGEDPVRVLATVVAAYRDEDATGEFGFGLALTAAALELGVEPDAVRAKLLAEVGRDGFKARLFGLAATHLLGILDEAQSAVAKRAFDRPDLRVIRGGAS